MNAELETQVMSEAGDSETQTLSSQGSSSYMCVRPAEHAAAASDIFCSGGAQPQDDGEETQAESQPEQGVALSRQSTFPESWIGGGQPQDWAWVQRYPIRGLTYLDLQSQSQATIEDDAGELPGPDPARAELEAEVQRLRAEMQDARLEAERARQDAERARQDAEHERQMRMELEQTLEDVQNLVMARGRGIKRGREDDEENDDARSEKRARAESAILREEYGFVSWERNSRGVPPRNDAVELKRVDPRKRGAHEIHEWPESRELVAPVYINAKRTDTCGSNAPLLKVTRRGTNYVDGRVERVDDTLKAEIPGIVCANTKIDEAREDAHGLAEFDGRGQKILSRRWEAACEPTLYRSLEIVITSDESTILTAASLLVTLSASDSKAHHLRELLVWYKEDVYSSSFDIMRCDIPISHHLFEVLKRTPNLSDLRIRNDCTWFLPMVVCTGFLDVIGSGVFQLRSLVAPFTFNRHAAQLERALLSRQRTLRSLGVQLIEIRQMDPWSAYVHKDCIRFSFQLFGERMSAVFAHPDPDSRTIEAVVRALPEATVGELHVMASGLPGRDVARLLAQHFSRAIAVSYRFTTTTVRIDTPSVVAAILPFADARSLIMPCVGGGRAERLAGDFHLAAAAALTDAGSKVTERPSTIRRPETPPMPSATGSQDSDTGDQTSRPRFRETVELTSCTAPGNETGTIESRLSDASSDLHRGFTPEPRAGEDDGSSTDDDMSPTQRQIAELPPGQGNNFRSFVELAHIPRMPSVISLGDEFRGRQGAEEVAHRVVQLQDAVREQLVHRDSWIGELEARSDDRRRETKQLREDLDKERSARKWLWGKRAKDKKKIDALEDALAEEKAARGQLENLVNEFRESKRKRDRDDDDEAPGAGPHAAKRVRAR
ncbi:hypothetical protein AURDEDRAFT_121952 [Auricularia subglabra TFB-10046 SS5]|nr:hypothetical protein AURDEDRAFT_121952 [Auricularia subglabra TFB-10046 SS5]